LSPQQPFQSLLSLSSSSLSFSSSLSPLVYKERQKCRCEGC
jgi:hypothetical protein